MFEQQSFEQEKPAAVTQGGELFNNYEVKSWELSPRLYKILGVSALFNVLAIALFSQADILTMKGCDSPFVGRVCQVLDTVYVGTVLLGTDRDYVDLEYERIDLGSSEITMIDVSNVAPPLSYPEGYFQLANPEQFMTSEDGSLPSGFLAPGIPAGPIASNPTINTPPGGGLISRAPRVPRANPNAVRGDAPKSPFEFEDDAADDTASSNSNKPDTDEVAQTNTNTNTQPVSPVNPTNPVAGVDINRRPLEDLGNYVNELRGNNEVDLESEFTINARGRLTKEGYLDKRTFRFVSASSSDEKMVDVVKESIEAINNAGIFKYLEKLSGTEMELTLRQDLENISGIIQSQTESEMRARSIKTALDLAISFAISSKQGANASQNDKDELELLKNATVITEGKKVIIRFAVPKSVAHPMIERKLAEQAAEAKKPNGNAGKNSTGNTAGR